MKPFQSLRKRSIPGGPQIAGFRSGGAYSNRPRRWGATRGRLNTPPPGSDKNQGHLVVPPRPPTPRDRPKTVVFLMVLAQFMQQPYVFIFFGAAHAKTLKPYSFIWFWEQSVHQFCVLVWLLGQSMRHGFLGRPRKHFMVSYCIWGSPCKNIIFSHGFGTQADKGRPEASLTGTPRE